MTGKNAIIHTSWLLGSLKRLQELFSVITS